MRPHGHDQGLDVVGQDEVTPLRGRPHAGAAHHADGTTGGHTQQRGLIVAGRFSQRRHVVEDRAVRVVRRGQGGPGDDVLTGHEGLEVLRAVGGGRAVEDVDHGGARGVADRGLHEEAVQLSFGQRVGARLLDGVLGRDHHEGLGRRAAHAVDRHLGLFHDLQEGGLRLGRRTVDFVGQDDLREDRAGVEDPLARLLVEHVDARDIRRQQVRGELDTRVRAVNGRADRARQRRLSGTGSVFEQEVAAGEHRGQGQAHRLALVEHRHGHAVDEALEDLGKPGCVFDGKGHECSYVSLVALSG